MRGPGNMPISKGKSNPMVSLKKVMKYVLEEYKG